MMYAIEIKNLGKRFGQTEVIRQCHLSIHTGERVSLIGPNGAGKSTLFHLLSGYLTPSQGAIYLNGQRIDGKKPFEINRLGLSRSFQTTHVFPNLSVFENLRCSVLWGLGYGYSFFRWLSRLKDVNDRVTELMARLHLEHKRDAPAVSLTYAEQRALELGMTVGTDANVVLLDEPTAGMSQSETLRFSRLIQEMTQGKTLVMVEHDMGVAFDFADRIAVLVQGEIVAFDRPSMIKNHLKVQEAYLGAPLGLATCEARLSCCV